MRCGARVNCLVAILESMATSLWCYEIVDKLCCREIVDLVGCHENS